MSGYKGDKFKIKKGAVVICSGITTKKMKYGGEPIDITSDDDSGWRTFLADSGTKSLDISFEGVMKDTVLRAIRIADANLLTDVTLLLENNMVVSGNFYLASYEESRKHDGAVEFSAELQSSGPMVFTTGV